MGKRGSEFNSWMTGIYAGLEDKDKKDIRDAAWEYIRFYDGPEARKICTKVHVEHGIGRFVQPELLKAAGYEEYIRQIPKGWPKAYKDALKNGVPEPYGKNCQNVYSYASRAINQIQTDKKIQQAIVDRKNALDAGDTAAAAEFEKQASPILTAEEREEDIDTLGGLVFFLAGRVPGRGEVICHSRGHEFEILDADPRRIRFLRIRVAGVLAQPGDAEHVSGLAPGATATNGSIGTK